MKSDYYMDDMRQAPDGWVCERTVSGMRSALEAGLVRRLSLDHDMGACEACASVGAHIGDSRTPATTFMNWCPHHEDGTGLVRWMVENDVWPDERPKVHSMNPVGAKWMREMIDDHWPLRTVGSASQGVSDED